MQFDILTIFPDIFNSYFQESILKRAQKQKIIRIKVYDLRKWAKNKHRTVDDTPYGGGAGMVLKIEPIFKAIQSIKSVKSKVKTRIILFSAKGKQFNQADARRLAKYERIIMICGRYEGVDERVAEHLVDEEISIGQYVLTGGEIPAMVLVDSISRLIPGVLGNKDSLKEESYNKILNSQFSILNSNFEYPHYTKPENFQKWKVPKVLLSGHHTEIEKWRRSKTTKNTDK